MGPLKFSCAVLHILHATQSKSLECKCDVTCDCQTLGKYSISTCSEGQVTFEDFRGELTEEGQLLLVKAMGETINLQKVYPIYVITSGPNIIDDINRMII